MAFSSLKQNTQSNHALGNKYEQYNVFFHPDYTVGYGITPYLLSLADFTADREFHPAPKTYI